MAGNRRERAEGFVTRLGEALLLAHADGQSVEGEWEFRTDDPRVPDVSVSVVEVGPTGASEATDATFDPDYPPVRSRVSSILFDAYAHGDEIEGVWTVRYADASLPEWSVGVDVRGPVTGGCEGE